MYVELSPDATNDRNSEYWLLW